MNTKHILIDGIELRFYCPDERHPWYYYEGLASMHGLHLSLAVPKAVPRREIQDHLRKFKSEHDVVSYQIYRI